MQSLHLKAALIVHNSLMLLGVLSRFIVARSHGKLFISVFSALFELFDSDALKLLERRQVLLENVDLVVATHSDKERLRLVLVEDAHWRHLVRRAHHEHHLVICRVGLVVDLEWHLLPRFTHCLHDSLVSLSTVNLWIAVN